MKKNNIILLIFLFIFSCAKSEKINNDLNLSPVNVTIGETLTVKDALSVVLYDENYNHVKHYKNFDQNIGILRFLDGNIKVNNNLILEINYKNKTTFQKLLIQPSVQINSFCASKDCLTNSGNVIEGIVNTLKVSAIKAPFDSISYKITGLNNVIIENTFDFGSVTNFDSFSFSMPEVPIDLNSYYSILEVRVYNNNVQVAETLYPFRVVRPIEIIHYGKFELAETFDPIPVTGCIPGTLGSRVSYSESISETRQNSATISISKNWMSSASSNIDVTTSDSISISETENIQLTSTESNSNTQTESETNSYDESEGSRFDFNTSDGENWSWSFNEGTSTSETNTEGNSSNIGVSGSVTTGTTVEGSIPILGKASGKIEVTAGGSFNTISSETNSETSGTSSSRGYVSSNSSTTGKSYGSSSIINRGQSLSGSYSFSTQESSSISEGESQTSGRVWNMSESLSSGKVVTQGDEESISETIVSSLTSTTTFSFSGYIPPNRVGVFYRQTSRYTKLSEIITYDINGFPIHSGYISMNTWAWAPDLSLGESCNEIPSSRLQSATCYIPPCGE